ncbi:MAG: DNA gyrase subunit A [Bacteroidales bacterium]|nr:DNA gyrase subunit A [Bacteroidales bacterium]MBR5092840.1 DNA gyrase subunit A [Bacteroidales bacterium]
MASENEKITRVDIEQTMKTAYIDYAMSVIVARALPDVRDGFKPVHRRILYSMNENGILYNTPTKKSARIVGDVMGKYHPHGDSSIYGALVRLAQDWSMRYTLVDGQGNFGSIDGDSPAAMRYTEARLKQISNELVADIDKDTVDMVPTYDNEGEEPSVLPAKIPNLLVNGSNGIAVGMATNMPTHNLREVLDGCMAYIDNNDIDVEGLMQYVKAPDFPLGGIIYGYNGVREAYTTGRGSIILRADTAIEEDAKGHNLIVATTIPYGVNKSEMIKKTANLVKEGKIEGILDIRDESDKDGIRVVYVLRNDVVPNVILNKLFQFTELQSSFAVNNIALVHGRPQLLNLKQLIQYFVEHREEVVTRRTRFEMAEAEKRAHILAGLLRAIDIIDEIVALIRASKTPDEARQGLMERYQFSDLQARAIVDMRLAQLTGLQHQKLQDEYDEKMRFIERCKEILGDHNVLMQVIKQELQELREKYGDDRRTTIKYDAANFRIEDTIPDEQVVITISHKGYIKRTPLTEYRTQSRGGVGAKGSAVRSEDFVEHIFTCTNHNYLLLFTEKGRCYWMRAFEVPEGEKNTKGRPILNCINIEPDDKVKAYVNVETLSDAEYVGNHYIVLCTRNGIVKKTSLEAYSRPRTNGIIAIGIREGDELLTACLTDGNSYMLIASKKGKVMICPEQEFRAMGRAASGVKGMELDGEEDAAIDMLCLPTEEENLLVVSEHGYGKRSALKDYRATVHRGGKGVKAMQITEKTGPLVAVTNVTDDHDLMIINRSGITIRMKVADLRVLGRATQGVKLIDLRGKDYIASITKVPTEEEEPENTKEETANVEGDSNNIAETDTKE